MEAGIAEGVCTAVGAGIEAVAGQRVGMGAVVAGAAARAG